MNPTKPVIRIGNAQAFWGDRGDAAAELLSQAPDLDYLTMDYLAEVSMSILAVQRERDASAGYARDFVDVVKSLAAYWQAGGRCRLIVNAGGLNPHGCAQACQAALESAGCRAMKIGVVDGDDILSLLKSNPDSPQFRNLETGKSLTHVNEHIVTANAYVGAVPMAKALAAGAEIVITGRVADPSLVVAACLHHFGWSETDWQRLAGATVAGHLIECGTQVTGGISTDWLSIPDPLHIGFPIVEVADDGSCVVTKPEGTGGVVNEWTVKEQLLYEIGDPAKYLSPDAAVSFLSLNVEEIGRNRVRVSGAVGSQRPATLKVSATYRDGYRAAGTLTLVGAESAEKAQRCGEIVLMRLKERGCDVRNSIVEVFGSATESLLRIAVESAAKAVVEQFSRELMPLITAGPQGTTGYAAGRPNVQPIFRYWPCLVDSGFVTSRVEILETRSTPQAATDQTRPRQSVSAAWEKSFIPQHSQRQVLRDIALARSGDKGTGANVGIIARQPADYEFLRNWLTMERVAEFFAADGVESVTRYELPNLYAFNFLLHGILRQNLKTDAQGKALGQRLLELPLPSR